MPVMHDSRRRRRRPSRRPITATTTTKTTYNAVALRGPARQCWGPSSWQRSGRRRANGRRVAAGSQPRWPAPSLTLQARGNGSRGCRAWPLAGMRDPTLYIRGYTLVTVKIKLWALPRSGSLQRPEPAPKCPAARDCWLATRGRWPGPEKGTEPQSRVKHISLAKGHDDNQPTGSSRSAIKRALLSFAAPRSKRRTDRPPARLGSLPSLCRRPILSTLPRSTSCEVRKSSNRHYTEE